MPSAAVDFHASASNIHINIVFLDDYLDTVKIERNYIEKTGIGVSEYDTIRGLEAYLSVLVDEIEAQDEGTPSRTLVVLDRQLGDASSAKFTEVIKSVILEKTIGANYEEQITDVIAGLQYWTKVLEAVPESSEYSVIILSSYPPEHQDIELLQEWMAKGVNFCWVLKAKGDIENREFERQFTQFMTGRNFLPNEVLAKSRFMPPKQQRLRNVFKRPFLFPKQRTQSAKSDNSKAQVFSTTSHGVGTPELIAPEMLPLVFDRDALSEAQATAINEMQGEMVAIHNALRHGGLSSGYTLSCMMVEVLRGIIPAHDATEDQLKKLQQAIPPFDKQTHLERERVGPGLVSRLSAQLTEEDILLVLEERYRLENAVGSATSSIEFVIKRLEDENFLLQARRTLATKIVETVSETVVGATTPVTLIDTQGDFDFIFRGVFFARVPLNDSQRGDFLARLTTYLENVCLEREFGNKDFVLLRVAEEFIIFPFVDTRLKRPYQPSQNFDRSSYFEANE